MRLKSLGIFGVLAAGLLMFSAATFAADTAPAPANTGIVPAPQVENLARGDKPTPVDGGEESQEPTSRELSLGTLLVTIAIFICLLIVLRATAWKPILTGLKSREEAIRESIEAAARAKADAERTTRDLEAKMADVQRQAAVQLQQAKADALKLADTIRQQAEAESAALKDRTLREIDGAKQQALAEINTHAAELGTAVARKILQRNVTPDDQQRLVDESLAELAKKN